MTTASNDRRKEYPGNGVATVFTGPRALSNADIGVYFVDRSTGVATLQTSGYTLTGAGGRVTTVTFTAPPPSTVTVQILRTRAYAQTTDLSNQGAYYPETLETGLDDLSMQVQQIADTSARSLRMSDNFVAPDGFSVELPSPDALKPLVWNAAANALENGSTELTGDLLLRPNLADTAAGKGAALVNWLQSGLNAIAQSVLDELRRIVRPEHFGAAADGATDDTAAIRAAITAAGTGGRVTFKEGKSYKISGTLTIDSNFIELYSPGMLDRAAKIVMASGVNAPLVESTGGYKVKINGVSLIGSSTTDTPLANQSCIKATSVNNIDIRNCVLSGAHDLISLNEICFYIDVDNVLFQACTRAWIYAVCTAENGIDMKITNSRGNTTQTAPYAFYFDGLGSLIWSDCQFSPGHCTVGGLYIKSIASLAGPSLFSNVVFELGATALYLEGSAARPVKWLHFDNCYFFGDSSVYAEYATKCHFDNCYFTGSGDGASGRNALRIGTVCTDFHFNNCRYEVTNVPIVTTAAATAISLYITNPGYSGAAIFCELSNLTTPANLLAFDCRGGNVGSNATPIKLPGEYDRKAYISCIGEDYGPIRERVIVGTFDVTGTVNIAHGITNGNKRIVSGSVYTRGGSAQMNPMTVNYIDNANINVAGATSGAVYRAIVRFMNDVDANWP